MPLKTPGTEWQSPMPLASFDNVSELSVAVSLLWDLSPNKPRESLCHWSCLEESNLYPWLVGTISAFSKSLWLLLWFSHCLPTQVALLKGLIQSSMLLELGNPAGVGMASPSSWSFSSKNKNSG